MRTMRALLYGAALMAPAAADAQPSLAILGLTSVDGDDSIADGLSSMLRGAAGASRSVRYVQREVALAQMVLAFGCDEPPDVECMRQIGAQMETDRIAYGYLRRSRPNGERIEVTLYLFDVRAGTQAGRTEATIPPTQGDVDLLRAPARRMLGRLFGESQDGTLRIVANVPDAVGRVDGRDVGPIGDGISLDVPAGSHQVEVGARDHRPHLETVEVEVGATTHVRAQLEPSSGEAAAPVIGGGEVDLGPRPNYLGWALTGAGALFGGIGLYFTISTVSHNGDSGEFYELRRKYPGSPDVCAETSLTTSEQELCDSATLGSTMQFVFYGAAAVAGGIGLYLLLGDSDGESPGAATALRIDPALAPDAAGLVVTGAY